MKKTRSRLREPEAVCEVRRIRTLVLRKARRIGIASYYLSLNNRPELVLCPGTAKPEALAESPGPYRATVREPEAVREVHEWRRKIRREMDRLGPEEYFRRLDRRAAEMPRVLKQQKRTRYKR